MGPGCCTPPAWVDAPSASAHPITIRLDRHVSDFTYGTDPLASVCADSGQMTASGMAPRLRVDGVVRGPRWVFS